MAGTTSPLGFPYPTDTDLVSQGDEAIQSLAEAVDDALVGVTSTAITPGTGVTIGGQGARVTRFGKLCLFRANLAVGGSGLAAGGNICAVPAGFRPTETTYATGINFTTGAFIGIGVEPTAGNVTVLVAVAAGTNFVGSLVYVIP